MDSYEQISTIVDMHKAPRFGRSSDIAKAASIDPSEKTDYFIGVGSFTFLVLFFFVVWGLTLIMCTWAGPDRAGWVGGKICTTKKRDLKGSIRLRRRLQLTFMICCLIVFLGCASLIGDGLKEVQSAVIDIKELNQDIRALIYEGMNIATSALKVQKNLDSEQMRPLFEVGYFCLNNSDNPFANGSSLESTIGHIVDEFDIIGALVNENVTKVNEDLLFLRDSSVEVEQYFTWFQQNDWLVKLYVLFLVTTTFFMMCTTLLSTCNMATPPLRFMTSLFLFPLYTTLVFVTLMGSCVLAIVTIMNADFCAGGKYPGSPEGTIEDALIYAGFNEDDLLYKSFSYYKEGCLTENPVEVMYGFEHNLQNMIAWTESVLSQSSNIDMEILNTSCGADVSQVWGAAQSLKANTETALENLNFIFDFSSCSKISPIYRRVFYGATCKESVVGLTWMFASLVLICFSGLMMMTFRAGMFKIKIESKAHKKTDANTITEQEEYEDYINHFYDESNESGNSAKRRNIQPAATFDTEVISTQSMDYSDDEYDVDLESVYSTPNKMLGIFRDEETFPLSPSFRPPVFKKKEPYHNKNMVSNDEGEILPMSPSLRPPLFTKKESCCLENNMTRDEEEKIPLSPTKTPPVLEKKKTHHDQSTGST